MSGETGARPWAAGSDDTLRTVFPIFTCSMKYLKKYDVPLFITFIIFCVDSKFPLTTAAKAYVPCSMVNMDSEINTLCCCETAFAKGSRFFRFLDEDVGGT